MQTHSPAPVQADGPRRDQRQSNDPRALRIAGYVMGGLFVLVGSTYVEVLAGWKPVEILQSLGAATAILVIAMIRGTARKERKDKLWITAVWHGLIGGLAALITWIQAQEEKADSQASGTTDAADSRTSGSAAPTLVESLSVDPADPDISAPDPLRIVERHGSWVRRQSQQLYTKEEHSLREPRHKRDNDDT